MKIESPDGVVPYLTHVLAEHLEHGERVVLLIPGGSGIRTVKDVINHLSGSSTDLSRLCITLTDERYGPLGHSDENWQRLLDSGIEVGSATAYRVLRQNATLGVTVEQYAKQLDVWMTAADYTIALFGIGVDGHIAGIKPYSPAVKSDEWAVGYQWDDFTRITSTPVMFDALDEAVVYAVGDDKHTTLDALFREDDSIETQPAQLLKRVPKCTVFTDYANEETEEE